MTLTLIERLSEENLTIYIFISHIENLKLEWNDRLDEFCGFIITIYQLVI